MAAPQEEPELQPAVSAIIPPTDTRQYGGRLPEPMNEDMARWIWELLVKEAGARYADWQSFMPYITDPKPHGYREFRFQGKLGFGGKLNHKQGEIYISCYPEDVTPQRQEIIQKVNYRLGEMYPAGIGDL